VLDGSQSTTMPGEQIKEGRHKTHSKTSFGWQPRPVGLAQLIRTRAVRNRSNSEARTSEVDEVREGRSLGREICEGVVGGRRKEGGRHLWTGKEESCAKSRI